MVSSVDEEQIEKGSSLCDPDDGIGDSYHEGVNVLQLRHETAEEDEGGEDAEGDGEDGEEGEGLFEGLGVGLGVQLGTSETVQLLTCSIVV